MRLVEDVDLAAPAHRRVGDALAQLADVVDRVVRGRVHLDHVERGGARDRHARVALAARLDRGPVLAVQARREDLRHRGLARAARAHEQVGVVHLAALDGVAQRAHDRLLADHVGERARAVPAVQGPLLLAVAAPAVRHRRLSLPTPVRAARRRPRAPALERIASALVSASHQAPRATRLARRAAGDRRRGRAAAADQRRRLRQLRHPLRARLGRAARARRDARLRRPDRAHPPPAGRAARRWCSRRSARARSRT